MESLLIAFYTGWPVWAAPAVFTMAAIALWGRHRYPDLYTMFSAGKMKERGAVLLIAALVHVSIYWVVIYQATELPPQARQGLFRFATFLLGSGLCVFFMSGTVSIVYRLTEVLSLRLHRRLFEELIWGVGDSDRMAE